MQTRRILDAVTFGEISWTVAIHENSAAVKDAMIGVAGACAVRTDHVITEQRTGDAMIGVGDAVSSADCVRRAAIVARLVFEVSFVVDKCNPFDECAHTRCANVESFEDNKPHAKLVNNTGDDTVRQRSVVGDVQVSQSAD